MQIETYASARAVSDYELRGADVLVIDVLRATSVITTALAAGCRAVILAEEVEEAVSLRRLMGSEALLGGERHAVRPEGFDLSNSPREYTEEAVSGYTLILTTTNGTRAICHAREAESIRIGCMRNVTAAARSLADTQRAVLLCAGTTGRFSLDDHLCAGATLDALLSIVPGVPEMDDLSRNALYTYRAQKNDLLAAVSSCAHYHTLCAAGFREDVPFCFTPDATDIVPVWQNDMLVRARTTK